MAFHHHHHHRATTASCCSSCTCQTPPYHPHTPPPPPPFLPPSSPQTTTDPFLISAIVTHLLQAQTPQDHINRPSYTNQFHQNHPFKQEQIHPRSSLFLSSLLQRIDKLETSLHHLSSSSSNYPGLYVKNAAARVIQTHFRALLVRRSRTLRQLKDLANVKSSLTCLKSSFSPHGFVDFDSLSTKAMDLLLVLDSIQGEDQMVRDGKKSITREIIQFLELVDGVCVKRHQLLTRKMRNLRLVRNENAITAHDRKRFVEFGRGSKSRNVDNEEKKLRANLRERVERIGKISRALDAEEVGNDVVEGFEHVDDEDGDEDGDVIEQITSNLGLKNGGVAAHNNVLHSNGKKRVSFLEDRNVIRVYDVDGDKVITSRDVEEMEDTLNGRQNEEEAPSDGEQSSQSSEGMRNQISYEAIGNHDHEFTFSVPEPKADFSTRKPGVKRTG